VDKEKSPILKKFVYSHSTFKAVNFTNQSMHVKAVPKVFTISNSGYTLNQGRCSWNSDSESNTIKIAGCLIQRGNSTCLNCANGIYHII
jgi:hypothetical protein